MKRSGGPIRIAAAGDVHCAPDRRAEIVESFAALEGQTDLVLLAGDLTTHGEPDQAEVLAEACRTLTVPVLAVLGAAGITVLDRGWTVLDLNATKVGVVGTKGFVGGFPDSELPDFGEPLLRQVYAETTAEVEAIERGLRAVAGCPLRIVLLHYAPTTTTLEGEPRVIWAFLGSDRLARPIAEHRPNLVLHGHGHAGQFEGYIGAVPVFNVSVPVIGRNFWVFDLDGSKGVRDAPV